MSVVFNLLTIEGNCFIHADDTFGVKKDSDYLKTQIYIIIDQGENPIQPTLKKLTANVYYVIADGASLCRGALNKFHSATGKIYLKCFKKWTL